MQSTIFRPTVRQLSKNVQKHQGFIRKVVTDPGNIPIIGANLAACTLLLTFGSRKLFFHPDVGVSEANRFSDEVQNEGSIRLDQAMNFREQTRFFARVLTGKDESSFSPTNAIMELYTGRKASEKFGLGFLKNTDIALPLESTDYFDDGLFVGNKSTEYSANISNEKDFVC